MSIIPKFKNKKGKVNKSKKKTESKTTPIPTYLVVRATVNNNAKYGLMLSTVVDQVLNFREQQSLRTDLIRIVNEDIKNFSVEMSLGAFEELVSISKVNINNGTQLEESREIAEQYSVDLNLFIQNWDQPDENNLNLTSKSDLISFDDVVIDADLYNSSELLVNLFMFQIDKDFNKNQATDVYDDRRKQLIYVLNQQKEEEKSNPFYEEYQENENELERQIDSRTATIPDYKDWSAVISGTTDKKISDVVKIPLLQKPVIDSQSQTNNDENSLSDLKETSVDSASSNVESSVASSMAPQANSNSEQQQSQAINNQSQASSSNVQSSVSDREEIAGTPRPNNNATPSESSSASVKESSSASQAESSHKQQADKSKDDKAQKNESTAVSEKSFDDILHTNLRDSLLINDFQDIFPVIESLNAKDMYNPIKSMKKEKGNLDGSLYVVYGLNQFNDENNKKIKDIVQPLIDNYNNKTIPSVLNSTRSQLRKKIALLKEKILNDSDIEKQIKNYVDERYNLEVEKNAELKSQRIDQQTTQEQENYETQKSRLEEQLKNLEADHQHNQSVIKSNAEQLEKENNATAKSNIVSTSLDFKNKLIAERNNDYKFEVANAEKDIINEAVDKLIQTKTTTETKITEEIQKYKQAFASAKNERRVELESQVRTYYAEHNNAIDVRDRLIRTKRNVKAEAENKLKEAIKVRDEKLVEANEQIASGNKTITKIDKELKALTKEKDKLETKLNDALDKYGNLKEKQRSDSEWRNLVTDLKDTIVTIDSKMKRLVKEKEASENKVFTLESNINEVTFKYNKLAEKYNLLNSIKNYQQLPVNQQPAPTVNTEYEKPIKPTDLVGSKYNGNLSSENPRDNDFETSHALEKAKRMLESGIIDDDVSYRQAYGDLGNDNRKPNKEGNINSNPEINSQPKVKIADNFAEELKKASDDKNKFMKK